MNQQILKNNIIPKNLKSSKSKRKLNVMLTCRDRTYFTQKCIEALHQNTKHFDKIDIYCFDNLTNLGEGRFSIFEELILENKIVFYSYDTMKSTNNCFPKSIAYYKWYNLMQVYTEIPNYVYNNFYLMIDNDMIVCPKWDDYFLTAAAFSTSETCYIVKRPGGVVARNGKIKMVKVKNIFNKDEEFDLIHAGFGGGSGFWFMNERITKKHVWTKNIAVESYSKTRGDDVSIWRAIDKTNGKKTQYVDGVTAPKDNPLVIHMGPVLGSMCNLTPNQYKKEKDQYDMIDEEISQMTIEEIIEKYKYENKCIKW
jgi:hypothetical protein